jgi:hypothetical protein
MSFSWAPDYRITLARPPAYAATSFTASWRLHTLIRGDFSLPTSGGVGQASLQFSDLQGSLRRKVTPQPMDVLRIEATGRTSPKTFTTVWTGYIDTVTERYDTQQGASLVLDATTPWKIFEVATQSLAAPYDASGAATNDAFALALAQLQGIGARALIGYVARTCRYPGSVGALHPNPANLQLYSGPEYVGQRSFSLPDNAAAEPDLQTYAAILSGLVADTGMELYCDEYGSLVWRPLGYLSVPTKPYRLEDDDILEAELGRSDQGVASQVRVRWAFDAYYSQDGYAPLPQDKQFAAGMSSLQRQLGTRVHVIDAPWVQTSDAANFLARAVLEQLAAGVAVGTLSIPTTPQIRVGTVIDVPPLTPGLARGYYYVLGKTSSWQWGGAWTDTLTLAYGRDPTAGFPYIGAQAAPDVHSPIFTTRTGGGATFTGHATLTATPTGQLAATYHLAADPTIPKTARASGVTYGAATGPFPTGTIVRVRDAGGHDVGSSPNGEYVITAQTSDGAIHLHSTGGVTSTGNVVVVAWGTVLDPTTTASSGGTPSGTTPPPQQSTPLTPKGSGSGTPAPAGGPGGASPLAVPGPPAVPRNLAQRALHAALTVGGGRYVLGTQGTNSPPTWDCSGLVWWAYTTAGYSWDRLNAGGQYTYFTSRNCPVIDLSRGTPGDLLFYGDMADANNQHVGFLHRIGVVDGKVQAVLFSAMNPTQGIADLDALAFHTEGGRGLFAVVNMQGFTPPLRGRAPGP